MNRPVETNANADRGMDLRIAADVPHDVVRRNSPPRQSPPAVLRSAGAVCDRVRSTAVGECELRIRDAVEEMALERRRNPREIGRINRGVAGTANDREIRAGSGSSTMRLSLKSKKTSLSMTLMMKNRA
jgi:hypothetical protein